MPFDDQPTPVRVCGAPGCSRALAPSQIKNKAQVCSVRCRVRAFRNRQRQAQLKRADAVEVRFKAAEKAIAEGREELAALRAAVAHG
jgi:hypothetical protein